MINISIKCFHEADTFEDSTAHEMVPNFMLEFETITFKCPVCGREVLFKILANKKELKKY